MSTGAERDDVSRHRARLFGVAYRMLGTRSDAEDVLQDAWLHWHAPDRAELQSAQDLSCCLPLLILSSARPFDQLGTGVSKDPA